ncbi:MAG: threonine/serine dehydratase [Asgard group archaeon]|nr:threonine/serine dehydratase [Asgard group archaeon]
MNLVEEALKAEKRIRKYIIETPLQYSQFLSKAGDCEVYLKLENMQTTGSFKIRGAMNKILSVLDEKKDVEFVTSSSGNHALAFAYSTDKLGLKGTVYLPEYTSKAKIEALQHYNLEINFYGDDCVKTEKYARKVAEKNNSVFISPYNDYKIIAGQATIAVELERQLRMIDSILVPIGGGGLISGVGSYLKEIKTDAKIIGCQPENSAVMYESIKAGKILDIPSKPTISDGTAGGIEENSITYDLCKKYVDDYILLSEESIMDAIRLVIDKHQILVEGAGALSIASFLKHKKKFKKQNIVLVISGSKISLDVLKEILCLSST